MKAKTILVTNDDGIKSPGLLAAVEAVIDLGEIIIIAPTNQQTGMSRSLRAEPGEYLRRINFNVNGKNITAYHCDASPAIIIQHAFNVLFHKQKPDLVISGINYGLNLGYDSMLSGTVGAAFQGASEGVISLAVSLQTEIQHHFNYGEVNWEGAKYFLNYFAKKMLENGKHEKIDVIKLDVPDEATKETEWRITKLAKQHYYSATIENPSVESKIDDTKIGVNNFDLTLDKECDIYAVEIDKVVSVTPMIMDLSASLSTERVKKYFQNNL